MILDPPTPLQWKALQECVVEHQNRFANVQNDNNHNSDDTNGDDNNGGGSTTLKSKTATIQAAPLIAIIDDASGYK